MVSSTKKFVIFGIKILVKKLGISGITGSRPNANELAANGGDGGVQAFSVLGIIASL